MGVVKRLDLTHPVNIKGLKQINWDKVKAAKAMRPNIPTWELFREAICNKEDCPMGYENCKSKRPYNHRNDHCWYYDLLKTVEQKEGED